MMHSNHDHPLRRTGQATVLGQLSPIECLGRKGGTFWP